MRDGVESGTSTSEWTSKLIGVASVILLPIVNGLLGKIGAAPLSEGTLQIALVSIAGMCAAYMGTRVWRKNAAAQSGLHNAQNAQIWEKITAARAIADPVERAKAIDAATSGI